MHDGTTLKIKHSMLCVTDVYLKDIIDTTNTFFPVLLLNVCHMSIYSSRFGLEMSRIHRIVLFLLFYSFTATVGGFATILGQWVQQF